jgi:hypothetical protein
LLAPIGVEGLSLRFEDEDRFPFGVSRDFLAELLELRHERLIVRAGD